METARRPGIRLHRRAQRPLLQRLEGTANRSRPHFGQLQADRDNDDSRPLSGQSAWDSTEGIGLPTYIENAYQLLDQPGEWYLDHAAKMLYYIPLAGQNMRTAAVVAPVLQTLIQGSGSLDSPIHDIQFTGLTLAYATWLAPTAAKGLVTMQANWGYDGQRMPANIVFTAAHNVQFQQDVFTHLGAAGLDLYAGSQNNVVNGCRFTDISGSGIQLGGIDDPDPADLRAWDSGNVISNNYIDNVADEYHGGVGIFAGYVADTVVSHNEVADLPYTGISLGWGWADNPVTNMVDNQIIGNNVHDVVQLLWDGGGIYTLGLETNGVIQDNYVHDIAEHGIYLDEGSAVHRHLEQRRRAGRRLGLHLGRQHPRPQRPRQLHRYDAVRQQRRQYVRDEHYRSHRRELAGRRAGRDEFCRAGAGAAGRHDQSDRSVPGLATRAAGRLAELPTWQNCQHD